MGVCVKGGEGVDGIIMLSLLILLWIANLYDVVVWLEISEFISFCFYYLKFKYDNSKQFLDEAEYDMKNYADLAGCYPPKPEAEVDNTLQGLHNSS